VGTLLIVNSRDLVGDFRGIYCIAKSLSCIPDLPLKMHGVNTVTVTVVATKARARQEYTL